MMPGSESEGETDTHTVNKQADLGQPCPWPKLAYLGI